MLNSIGLAAAILLTLLLAWSSFRARRIEHLALRWIGAGVAAVLALAVGLASALVIAGLYKAHSRSAPVPTLGIALSSERIARGQAIADTFCAGCHTKTGPLTGGWDISEELPMPVGSLVTANLTPAGDLSRWSDGEIFRAIRNGVDAEGHWLVIMSYTNAGKLSDSDVASLIAYLRSLPAAGQATPNPPDRLNLLGLAMLGAGMLPPGKPIVTGTVIAPPKGATLQYGEYILSYQDCRECHGANLTGGVEGQLAPIGPTLELVKGWTAAEFIATLRTGVDPGGHAISAKMPWRPIGRMDDAELTAVYEYLTHLPGTDAAAAN